MRDPGRQRGARRTGAKNRRNRLIDPGQPGRAPASGHPDRVSAYAHLVVAKLTALVVPLGLDTFAVAAALGMVGVSRQRRLRITLLFTAFETGMPLIGLALGAPLGQAVGGTADYLAIGVLLAFGVYTLAASEHHEEETLGQLTQMHGLSALLLGVSISLDELAIGFTLGLLRLPAVLVIVLIAIQTMVVTQLGLRLGSRLSERLREGAERLAGAALTGLGLALLTEKLLA
jgi:manganese efflux pump family protein